MEYIKEDNILLELNSNETLWLAETKETGKYHYEIKTKNNEVYIAELDWIKPEPKPEPEPEPTPEPPKGGDNTGEDGTDGTGGS